MSTHITAVEELAYQLEQAQSAYAENKTWRHTKRPSSGLTLSASWVYKIKRDKNGDVIKYKARLVARGFEQKLTLTMNRRMHQ